MSYLIQWDNEEKTVVFQQYVGNPVKDDLYDLAEESALMLKSVSHTVHIIIDERITKVNLTSVDIKHLEKHVPTNQGASVTVVMEKSLAYKKYIQDIGKKLGPNAFKQPYHVTTIEEARHLLQGQFSVRYP